MSDTNKTATVFATVASYEGRLFYVTDHDGRWAVPPDDVTEVQRGARVLIRITNPDDQFAYLVRPEPTTSAPTTVETASASCELRVEWRAPRLGERGWCVLATTPAAPGTPDPHECIPTATGRTRTTVVIEVEVDHPTAWSPEDAINHEMDAGTLQEAIGERASDEGCTATVTSTTVWVNS